MEVPEEIVFFLIDQKYFYAINNQFKSFNTRLHLDKYKVKYFLYYI